AHHRSLSFFLLYLLLLVILSTFSFVFNTPETTQSYTLSLHDALPISRRPPHHAVVRGRAHRPRRPRPAVPAPSRDGPRGPPAARARPFAQRPAPAPLPRARPRGTAGRGPLARHARTSAARRRHGDGEG